MDGKDFTERNPHPEEADPAAEDDEPYRRYAYANRSWDVHEFNWEELERWRDEIVDFVVLTARFEKTMHGEGREPVEKSAIRAAVERYQREQQQNVSYNRANGEPPIDEARNTRSASRDSNSNNDPGNPHDFGSPHIAFLRQKMKVYKDKMERVLELIKDEIPPADPESIAANANTPSTSRGSGQSAKPSNSAEESPGPI
nr:unnamed protein product [Haemonchus contortus]